MLIFNFQAIVLSYHVYKIPHYYYHVLNHFETITYGVSLLFAPRLCEDLLNIFQDKQRHYGFCLNAPENYELPVREDTMKGQVIL